MIVLVKHSIYVYNLSHIRLKVLYKMELTTESETKKISYKVKKVK